MGTCDTPPLALSPNQSPHSTIQQNLQTIHVPLETQSFQLPRLTSQQPICVSPKTQSTQSPCPREESSIRREESSIQREESSIRREESSIRREESSIRREGSSIRREEQMCPPSILKSDGGKILLSSFSWIEKAAACHQPDILVISSPRFVVYKDAKLMNTEKAGGLNKTQVDQLLRTTITNMQTELSLRKYPRTPSDEELEEMAKALTITYPSLIDELNSHEDCLSKLTRRVYNDPNCRADRGHDTVKKAVDSAGDISEVADGEVAEVSDGHDTVKRPSDTSGDSASDITEVTDGETTKVTDGETTEVLGAEAAEVDVHNDRFMILLSKESNKKTKNLTAIHFYLNKTFNHRRSIMKTCPTSEKLEKLLKIFPAMEDPIEIINEVRRLKNEEEALTFNAYPNKRTAKLASNLDNLIYYALSKKGLDPPKLRKPDDVDGKLRYVLENFVDIFQKKTTKRKVHVELHDNDDPEKATSKLSAAYPILILESSKHASLLLNKTIIFRESDLALSIVALIGMYYLLDMDYPHDLEIGLTMLQVIIYEDLTARKKILKDLNKEIAAFQDFVEGK
ncbi:uncharacterized protein [Clytia hemisphaerica]|uniref:uncharacterized protein n=1 Tax=Clytia hemisphaerica TaxID=252671 RepID=UPI0034D7A4D8